MISGLLAEAAERGTFRAMPPRLTTLQFLNLHNHTYQWVRPGGQWDAALLAREYCGTLFRGFGAAGHAVLKAEEQAEAFKRERPEVPLDPEAEWESASAVG